MRKKKKGGQIEEKGKKKKKNALSYKKGKFCRRTDEKQEKRQARK